MADKAIEFNEDAARRIEAVYLTPDVVEQRCRTLRALNLRPGERVLDVGSGPGLLLREMAAIVGAEGSVVGFDMSASMLAMAGARCADQPWVSLQEGNASTLPFEDADFAAVVATQVYEYVADIPSAFAELYRVTAPGGRLVIVDTDYDSWVVNTLDSERFRRIRDAWDEHFVHGDLPRKMIPHLRDAGFETVNQEVIPMFNTEYHSNTYSYGIVAFIAQFVAGRGEVTAEEAQAWKTEMETLGKQGGYFFSLNRYQFTARKPGSILIPISQQGKRVHKTGKT
jgi:ubiquinone/menaquinone biosynthesis C-methylase UbiE